MKKSIIFLILAACLMVCLSSCWLHKHPAPKKFQLYDPNFTLDDTLLKTKGAYAYNASCDQGSWGFFKFFKDGRVLESVMFNKVVLDTINVEYFHVKNKGVWGYYRINSNNIEIELNLTGYEITSPFIYYNGTIEGDTIKLSSTSYLREYRSKKRKRQKINECDYITIKHVDCCLGDLE